MGAEGQWSGPAPWRGAPATCPPRLWRRLRAGLPTLKMRQSSLCSANMDVSRYWLSLVMSTW